jgi:hypothetical protein
LKVQAERRAVKEAAKAEKLAQRGPRHHRGH